MWERGMFLESAMLATQRGVALVLPVFVFYIRLYRLPDV